MVSQGTKTVQEVLNDLNKYAAWMIHQPNVYTFCKQFVSALHDLLCNEVLNKGYNAEFSTIEQLYETAQMVEEASWYNHRMRHMESTHMAASNTKPAANKAQLLMGKMRTVIGREIMVHRMQTVNTQAKTHAQIHIHAQIPAYVQLPALFQPHAMSQPNAHLHCN